MAEEGCLYESEFLKNLKEKLKTAEETGFLNLNFANMPVSAGVIHGSISQRLALFLWMLDAVFAMVVVTVMCVGRVCPYSVVCHANPCFRCILCRPLK